MEVDYYSKYLKYKAKYLELKNQMGGNGNKDTQKSCCNICNCIKYDSVKGSYEQNMCSCGHLNSSHTFTKPEKCVEKIKLLKAGTKCCSCNCAEFKVYVDYNNKETPDKCACTHPLSNHLNKKIKQCDKLPKSA